MDKLQWFKFTPTDWVMGKIQRIPEVTQARFMRLLCLYWNKECVLSYEDSEIEIDKEHLDLLINKKIIKVEGDYIIIQFLDEQMIDISETSKKRREAVLKRWDKVKQNDTSVLQNNTSVLQNNTEKRREEKEKRREEVIFNNTIDSVFEEIVSNQSDWEVYCKNKSLGTVVNGNRLLKEFLTDNMDNLNRPITDIKTHFKRWINKLPPEKIKPQLSANIKRLNSLNTF